MKNLRKLMLLFVTVPMVTMLSCSKDDDGGSGGGAAEGTIVAKVGGTSVTTVEIATFASINSGTLQLQGNTGGTSSKAFVLTVIGFDGEGTYAIGGGPNVFNTASYMETVVDLADPMNPDIQTWQAPYDDTEAGELNVSEVTDTHIKGTFHYTAKNVSGDGSIKTITEGSFNIQLIL